MSLVDLPAPPEGKTGWPWTEQSELLGDRMSGGSEWPKISIVTPSYNYGQFIEETIRSVLLQSYPNLEYIIIDGCSNDQTPNIIKKYESWLTFWCSEPDGGQTDAINKGFMRCTGHIFVWLNADDAYLSPTCLHDVASLYLQGHQLIVGTCLNVDAQDQEVLITKEFNGIAPPQTFDDYVKFLVNLFRFRNLLCLLISPYCDKAFPLDIGL